METLTNPSEQQARGERDAAAGVPRYSVTTLVAYALTLLSAAGMAAPQATAVAETLVEADLLGHDTHGLAQLPGYLRQIETGAMRTSGAPIVLAERGATLLWDGQRLPGPWLVRQGVEALMPKAREFGTATLVIRRSHHIACLAAYLAHAADAGFLLVLASSDPNAACVAPHGGRRAVFTPNPIAAGIPTSGTPLLVDISSSCTTVAMSARIAAAGQQFDEACMLDADGHASRDPTVLDSDPPGTILPLGGMSGGHKGYGLALLIEALTGGLSGFGRADPPEGWGATVSMTLYDPAAFAGLSEFNRQMDWIADACRTNPPRPGTGRVRVPGDNGLKLKAAQVEAGVALNTSIAPLLAEFDERYSVAFPVPIGS